jgi:hypothetical protein
MLLSLEANLLEKIMERLADKAPNIRFVGQDLGQLENYEMRPAVSFPCSLIDIEELDFTDAAAGFVQITEGMITIRTALVKYTDVSNLTPLIFREKGFQYYEEELAVYKALHGWSPDGYSRLLRRKVVTEKRNDDIRVRLSRYAISWTDRTATPATQSVARPGATIGI